MDAQENVSNVAEATPSRVTTAVKPNTQALPGFQTRPQGPSGPPRQPLSNGPTGPRPGGPPPIRRLDSRSSLGPPGTIQFPQPRPYGPPRQPGNTFPPRPTQPGQNPAIILNPRYIQQAGPRGPLPQQVPRGAYPGNYQVQRPINAQRPQPPSIEQALNQNLVGLQRGPESPSSRVQETIATRILQRNESQLNVQRQIATPSEEEPKHPPTRPRIVIEKMDVDSARDKQMEGSVQKKKTDLRENGENDDDDDDVVMDSEKSPRANGSAALDHGAIIPDPKSPQTVRKNGEVLQSESRPGTGNVEDKKGSLMSETNIEKMEEKIANVSSKPVSADSNRSENLKDSSNLDDRPSSVKLETKDASKVAGEEKRNEQVPEESPLKTKEQTTDSCKKNEVDEKVKASSIVDTVSTVAKDDAKLEKLEVPITTATIRESGDSHGDKNLKTPTKSPTKSPSHTSADILREEKGELNSPAKTPQRLSPSTVAEIHQEPKEEESKSLAKSPEKPSLPKSPDKASLPKTPGKSSLTPQKSPEKLQSSPQKAPEKSQPSPQKTVDNLQSSPHKTPEKLQPSSQKAVDHLQSSPQKAVDNLQPSPQKTPEKPQPSPQKTVGDLQSSPQKSAEKLQASPQKSADSLQSSPQKSKDISKDEELKVPEKPNTQLNTPEKLEKTVVSTDETSEPEKPSENPHRDKSDEIKAVTTMDATDSGPVIISPEPETIETVEKSPSKLSVQKRGLTPPKSPEEGVKGFDNGQRRSLSPRYSPQSPASPKSPKSPDSVKLIDGGEKKKATFAEDVEDKMKEDGDSQKRSDSSSRSSRPCGGKIQRTPTPAKLHPEKKKPPKPEVQNGSVSNETCNVVPTTNGVGDSPTKKSPSKSRDSDKRSTAGSPVKSPSKSAKSLPRTPDTPTSTGGQDKKKLPMNKVQVGSAPSPNLKTVRSKIGSLDNASYKPGGGNVKIENRKLDFSKAQPKIAAKNEKYAPSGGDKKIAQVKLQWNAKPKVGSLDNATYKPGGGDKKIETVKLDFKDKAKPKVGSKDNAKHVPGGGTVKSSSTPPKTPQENSNDIATQKVDIKAESKVGSLDNVKHKPGGGDKKIFNDKDYLRQSGSNVESLSGSGTQVGTPAEETGESIPMEQTGKDTSPQPPPSTPTKSKSVTSPTAVVTPKAVRNSLAKSPETTGPRKTIVPPVEQTNEANKKSSSLEALENKTTGKDKVRSPTSARPPNSLRLKSPDKSSPATSRKSSPRGVKLPKLASSPVVQETTPNTETHSKISLPKLIEPAAQSTRVAH